MKKTQARKETLTQVAEDFNEIVAMVAAAPQGEVLDAVEGQARRMALHAYGKMVENAVKLRGKEWKKKASAVCTCGGKMRMPYRSAKEILTLLGPMKFDRRYYYCDECKQSRVPFDEEMGLSQFSDGAQRAIVLSGSTQSFIPAVHQLKEIGEIHVSKETVRRLTEHTAQNLQAIQESGELVGQETAWRFAGEDRAYVTMDGTMVNTCEHQWREVKVGAFYDQEKEKQHYAATVLPAQEFGQMMRRHGRAVALGKAGELIAGGDGAPWIWKQMQDKFPMATRQLLDFYHLAENVHGCAKSIYGQSNPKGKRWAKDKLRYVRRKGGKRLLGALKASRTRSKSPEARQALATLINYLAAHLTRTHYPQLKALGIDIGTGPQESACKNIVGQRLKGRGMRWCISNAEAMIRLRAYIADARNWDTQWTAYKKKLKLYRAAA